jgi:hypothetical protein
MLPNLDEQKWGFMYYVCGAVGGALGYYLAQQQSMGFNGGFATVAVCSIIGFFAPKWVGYVSP